MNAEIIVAKGKAYCRMCENAYTKFLKGDTLKGKKCLSISGWGAGGGFSACYCMSCAKKIKKTFEGLDIP